MIVMGQARFWIKVMKNLLFLKRFFFYFGIIDKGLWAYNCSQVVVRSESAGKAF